jgi:hypothetical protein
LEDGMIVPGPVVADGALAVVVTLKESNELYNKEINIMLLLNFKR